MKKPTKPKKRNMQDATLINTRAVNRKLKKLEERVKSLEHETSKVWMVWELFRADPECPKRFRTIPKLEAEKR